MFVHVSSNTCTLIQYRDPECHYRHPKIFRYKDHCRRRPICLYTHTNTENEKDDFKIKMLNKEIEELKHSNNEKTNLLVKMHLKEIDELKQNNKDLEQYKYLKEIENSKI